MKLKNEPVVLPVHLLEKFFHEKPIRFSTPATLTQKGESFQMGLLTVGTPENSHPCIRVASEEIAPSGKPTFHCVVSAAMLDKMQWDEEKMMFFGRWFPSDLPSA